MARDEMARAASSFDLSISASVAWRDPQWSRLEQSHIAPLRDAAFHFVHDLAELDAALDAAAKLLAQS